MNLPGLASQNIEEIGCARHIFENAFNFAGDRGGVDPPTGNRGPIQGTRGALETPAARSQMPKTIRAIGYRSKIGAERAPGIWAKRGG